MRNVYYVIADTLYAPRIEPGNVRVKSNKFGIGRSHTAPPSHTTGHTEHVSGGSAD
jgi:hypothetical protein